MDNYLAWVAPKVAGQVDEAPDEESDLEVVGHNLDVQPLVFRLRAEEDFGENCPQKESNECLAMASCSCISGNSGVSIIRTTVNNCWVHIVKS